MIVKPGRIPGVFLLEPKVARDERGYFAEVWQRRRYAQAGFPEAFVQDNVSVSVRGVLRGLHLQNPAGQGKLISTPLGVVYDVAVDVRRDSPTFGVWEGYELSDENHRQLYLPEGVAHGMLVLSERAVLSYKCTRYYTPEAELTIRWSDPDLAIEWPATPTIISPRDAAAPRLRDLPPERLPVFASAAGEGNHPAAAALEP